MLVFLRAINQRRSATIMAFNNRILVAGERQTVVAVVHIVAVDQTVLAAAHLEVVGVGHTEVVVAVAGQTEAVAHIAAAAVRTGVVARIVAEEAAHTAVAAAGSWKGHRSCFPSFRIGRLILRGHQAELVAAEYS